MYLRGCALNRLAINDTLAKAAYLRMLNYPETLSAEFGEYSENELTDLIDNPFGILLIAGCKDTYERFADSCGSNVIMHEIMTETAVNVYTRLIVSPELGKSFMLENYKKVIFLNYPPSLNVIGYINRRTNAAVYVPKTDNRKEMFACVKSDRAVFGHYFKALKANAGIKAPNIYAFYKALHLRDKSLELPQLIACLSVFTQLNLLSFKANCGITVKQNNNALQNSAVYRTIEDWQV